MKKKHSLLLMILPILLLGLLASNMPVKAPYPTPYVKMYVSPGTVGFVAPGGYVQFYIKIETHGMTGSDVFPGASNGVVGWGVNIQVDPNVLNISKAAGAVIRGEYTSSYFLWDFADWHWYDYPTFLGGSPDDTTGYWRDISAQLMPTPSGGSGDEFSPANAARIRFVSKSNTQPCIIDLVRAVYWTTDGNSHPVEIVVDGFYGAVPTYMSETTGAYVPTLDPTGTTWHEDYPNFCELWNVHTWTDNGDNVLSASDQLEMENSTGVHWWHVDAVTTTIHWTFKPDGQNPDGDLRIAEPTEVDFLDLAGNPIGSVWHQIYPDYCRWFTITSWEDNGDQVFSESDQFDFIYEDDPTETEYYAHLDAVTTDIILSYKGESIPEFPLGLGLMIAIAPAIPIVYLWRLRKKVVAK